MDLRKDILYYDALVDFPANGQENKLYLNKADGALYYWDGAAYQLAGDGSGGVTSVTASTPLASSGGATPNITLTVPGNTTTFLRGDGTFATPPAGGLTKFTEAESTSAPNGTVYVDSLTAAGASTNADIAIVPKGTGAFLLDIPDNADTGGNKRGQNSIDLQTLRLASWQVASGNYSFCAGSQNSAQSSFSVALGVSSDATADKAVAIGDNNAASGDASFAVGSYATASNQTSISMGTSTVASGVRSVAIGNASTANATTSYALGTQAHVFGIIGRYSYCAGVELSDGDSQYSKFVLRERTTGNTATTLTTNSSAASTNNQVILSNNSAYRFKGTIIGKKSGTTDVAAWDIDGIIVRGANAAATTLSVSTVTLVQNTPAWGTPTLAADTTNGGLQVQVTGAAATNIQWTANIETTEVIYA